MKNIFQISGWGRNKKIYSKLLLNTNKNFFDNSNIIFRSNGRSYGDSSLNKKVIVTAESKGIISFDKSNGIIAVEAGVTLGQILDVTVKDGWFLNVVSGSQFVSVGGAIAADVHGKNHHNHGSFAEYVLELKILTEKYGEILCGKNKNSNLFKLTCGGMGLTGEIKTAKIKLKKIKSPFIEEEVIRGKSLDKLINLFEVHKKKEYVVGWFDFFSKDEKFILSVGKHSKTRGKNNFLKTKDYVFPSILLNDFTIRIFNKIYYLKNLSQKRVVHYKKFFFPLDAINNWNTFYGDKGFYQYQFVIPEIKAKKNLDLIIREIKLSKCTPYLAVFKKMGKKNKNVLSFPIKGYTFALDFKNTVEVKTLFKKLDKIIISAKGRVYLAKDSTLSASDFKEMYPNHLKFSKNIGKFNRLNKIKSLQSVRIGLTR